MSTRQEGSIKFRNGTLVGKRNEARYLGCMINDKGDTTKEINKRISECHLTWT